MHQTQTPSELAELLEATELLEELQFRAEHKFHTYKAHHDQVLFHQSEKYIRLLFGGNQSGKSHAAAQEIAWWFTHKHPYLKIPDRPLVIWVISTEYATLTSGIYRHLKNIIPTEFIAHKGPKVQGHPLYSYLESKNGDIINFMSAKGGEEARTKFQAAEVDLVAIDEEIEYHIWDELQSRMITSGGRFIISATLVESYDWIVELERAGTDGDGDVFLGRLNTEENPYRDERQVERLKERWDEDTLRYRIYGYSRRSTGLVYKNYGAANRIEPFSIPESWTRWSILDPGYRVFAVLWGAISPYGQKFAYRELYLTNAELGEVVAEMKLLEAGEKIFLRIIDDKEGSKLITGEIGVMTQLSKFHQIYCVPAIKAKHAGIEAVRRWLMPTPAAGTDEFYEYKLDNSDILTLPKSCNFFVFNDMPHFHLEAMNYSIKPMKQVKRDRNAVVDDVVKKDDHLMDDLRYWAITDPEFIPTFTAERKIELDPLGAKVDLETAFAVFLEKKLSGISNQRVHDLFGAAI